MKPPNRFRQGFCRRTGKKRWRDHAEAVRALHLASAARSAVADIRSGAETDHREVRSYRCSDCGGWHLTSQPSLPSLAGARD